MTEGKICGKEYMKELLDTEQTDSGSEETSSCHTSPEKRGSARQKTNKGLGQSGGSNFSKSAEDQEKDSMMPEVGGLGGIERSSKLIEKFGNFQFLKMNSIKKREFWKQKKLDGKKEKFQRGEMPGVAMNKSEVGLSSNRTEVAGDGMVSTPGPAIPYRSIRNSVNASGFGALLEKSMRKTSLGNGRNFGHQVNPVEPFMQIKLLQSQLTDEETELSGIGSLNSGLVSPKSGLVSPKSRESQIRKFGPMSPKYSKVAKPNID